MLDSGAGGPEFKPQPRRCRVTVLGKPVHNHRASVHQAAKWEAEGRLVGCCLTRRRRRRDSSSSAARGVERRVVQTVVADCDEGRVVWRYPHSGGLHITFQPPAAAAAATAHDDHETTHDVCMIAAVEYCDVRLSLDAGDALRTIAVLQSTGANELLMLAIIIIIIIIILSPLAQSRRQKN